VKTTPENASDCASDTDIDDVDERFVSGPMLLQKSELLGANFFVRKRTLLVQRV
jgi:hypothetical protein